MKDRIGVIRVNNSVARDTGLVDAFFSLKIFPLRTEHHFLGMFFEITGVSEFFDEIGEGVEPPFYNVEFIREDDESVTVKMERQK